MALYPRSLWRFEVCPCRPTPGGRPPSPVKFRLCLKLRQSVLTAHYTLVFQTAPQPLDEDIIHPSAPSVHRNAHTGLPQNAGKSWRSELAALVRVHNSGILPSIRAPKSPFTIHITRMRPNASR